MNKAIAKYQLANERNILESEAQWGRSNSFLVFNSILIAAITFSHQNNVNLPWFFVILLPLGGFASCWLWYRMNSRSFKWIHYWIDSAREIEYVYLKDQTEKLNPVLEGKKIYEKNKSFLNSEGSTNFLIGIIAVIYILFFFSTACSFSKTINNVNHHKQTHWQRNYQNYNDKSVLDRGFPN